MRNLKSSNLENGCIPYEFDEPGSDGYELKKMQKTTITPLKIDLTSDMSLLKEWLR